MTHGPRAPFAADRLVRPGDFDAKLDDVAQTASLVQQHEQPTLPVEHAPKTDLNDDLVFAHEALQRAFM